MDLSFQEIYWSSFQIHNYDIGKNTGGMMGGTLLDSDMQGYDVNGLPLTYNVVTLPNGGTFTQTGTTSDFTYVPPLNITGKRTFTYTVNNGCLLHTYPSPRD